MIMMMMSMNMMFILMNHPLSMGLTLIIQTLIISIVSGMLIKTFWMSYILTITMLSGMLVLFIYMSSVASNEKFKTNMYMWIMVTTLVMMSLLFLFMSNKMIIKNNYFSMEMMTFKMMEIHPLNKMFNMENMSITIMMVIYLLITMIVSTHLVNIFEGPMRMKM